MRQKLLLIKDVEDLGKSGDIVIVKAGYARNFLFPKGKGVIADKHTLLLREKLIKERTKRSEKEKLESEELAKKMRELILEIEVKVDPDGKMYGSVSHQEILNLLKKEGIELTRKSLELKHPIKDIGVFDLHFKLKEGIVADCKLKIIPEEKKTSKE